MRAELDRGYTQATDLAEHLVGLVGVDYRTAYVVVGNTVRAASTAGVPGAQITGDMLDKEAVAHTGRSWDLSGVDLTDVLDPASIVASRRAEGGAAADALAAMVAELRRELGALAAVAEQRALGYAAVEEALLDRARTVVG
jgi:argininosuccinate lyase